MDVHPADLNFATGAGSLVLFEHFRKGLFNCNAMPLPMTPTVFTVFTTA